MTSSEKRSGELIRAARQAIGKTQGDCAKTLGMTQPNCGAWEAGRNRLPKKHISSVAKLLHIDENLLRELCNKESRRKVFEQAEAIQLLSNSTQDILPLIRSVSKSKCDHITIGDIQFLTELQQSLPSPISPTTITELIKNRHSK